MRFYEFECKLLLAKQGVPLPHGGTANTPEQARQLAYELRGPVVLKSQVLSGGRMKAGGVKFADTLEEAEGAAAVASRSRKRKRTLKAEDVFIAGVRPSLQWAAAFRGGEGREGREGLPYAR